MSLPNQLRLGQFNRTMALVVYRPSIDWRLGKGHLQIDIVEGLFVSQLRPATQGMHEVVTSCRRGYQLNLVLEPRRGTPEHARYVQWERNGMSRRFYDPVEGTRRGHALLFPPSSIHDYTAFHEQPTIGGGGGVDRGHLFIVEPTYVGYCVYEALTDLGVTEPDRGTLGTAIISALENGRRQHGF